MRKVVDEAKVENLGNLDLGRRGTIEFEEVRSIEVREALVDTGPTTISMPNAMILQLGLEPLRKRQARTNAGIVTFQIDGAVRLTIQGRDGTVDVTEVPDNSPVLIGQVPFELLAFIVDPATAASSVTLNTVASRGLR